jgi:L-alanine-DL-glutamate epimerase-like enolase superfamily enzyme
MRIAAVTPIPVTFPTEREPMSFCFVRVDTDDGVRGYGEACDSFGCSYAGVVAAAIRDAFAPLLVGHDVADPAVEGRRMRAWTRRRLGDGGVAAQALSAVEIALWDAAARADGAELSTGSVPVYASVGFLEEGPAEWHLAQVQPLLDRGVRMVKVRVGPDWRSDLATLEQLRAALGDGIEVMVDGSETFTVATASRIAERLGAMGVAWFEEPLPQAERGGIEALVRRSAVPIAYGEHLYGFDDALDALRRHQADVLQPDASTCGGIGEARRIADLGASFGVRVVPHVCAGPVSLAANLHVAASVPTVRAIEYPPFLLEAWAALATGPDSERGDGRGRWPRLGLDAIEDGALAVPAGPGLGVELDEAAAAAYPYRPPQHVVGVRGAGNRDGFPSRFVGDR